MKPALIWQPAVCVGLLPTNVASAMIRSGRLTALRALRQATPFAASVELAGTLGVQVGGTPLRFRSGQLDGLTRVPAFPLRSNSLVSVYATQMQRAL